MCDRAPGGPGMERAATVTARITASTTAQFPASGGQPSASPTASFAVMTKGGS